MFRYMISLKPRFKEHIYPLRLYNAAGVKVTVGEATVARFAAGSPK